jgi:hypothetical protein
MSESLIQNGYLVLPAPKIENLREEFIETCKKFPEFKPNAEFYILGGFSALGNPGSFHNLFVRKLRQLALPVVLPVLRDIVDGRKLEQVIDRMLYRPKGRKPMAESWYMDESPYKVDSPN